MPLGPAPIAQVAGEAATSAALQELAGELQQAREEGRLIQALEVDRIDQGYLVRDRLVADDDELQALMELLRARGQQTPVEVVALPDGRFGLISGWRRLTALRRLLAETGEARFGLVQAILRRPETAADAYVAMVEENEIRVGLSYYERARVAAKAVEQGVFETEKAALLALYASASRPKRSKIRSFLTLYHAADDLLRFPAAIGERLGLALSKVLDGAPARCAALRRALTDIRPETAEAEQAVLRGLLTHPDKGETVNADVGRDLPGDPGPKDLGEVIPGVTAEWGQGRLVLSGSGMSEPFLKDLIAWIRESR